MIEGIGPKTESVLNAYGILTFGQLADTNPAQLLKILKEAGSGFQKHAPSTLPHQSKLASDGKIGELGDLQLQPGRGKTI